MKPAIVMIWPGAVPIFPKCELCDGKGHKVYNAETRRVVSADGMIDCTMLFGETVICARCTGWGNLTRYGERGRSFTPIVKPSRPGLRNLLSRLNRNATFRIDTRNGTL